jgi:hypothetical protein
MQLANEWWARQAAEEYGHALAAFQAECPRIENRKEVKNKDGSTRYKYAPFEHVDAVARPILAKYQVATSCSIESKDTLFVATWRVQVGSHFRDLTFSFPLPDFKKLAQDMHCNEMQAQVAATSYLKRMTFCSALHIVCEDEDSNGAPVAANMALCEPEQLAEIDRLMTESKVDRKRFLAWLDPEIASLAELKERDFTRARDELKALAARRRKEAVK